MKDIVCFRFNLEQSLGWDPETTGPRSCGSRPEPFWSAVSIPPLGCGTRFVLSVAQKEIQTVHATRNAGRFKSATVRHKTALMHASATSPVVLSNWEAR